MRLLGIDAGERELRLAYGERVLGTLRLTRLVRVPLDAPAAGAARPDTRTARLLAALPLTAVTHRTLVLPFRDRRRLAGVVPLELLGQLPVEPDDARVAFAILGPANGGTAVLAAVTRQADVEAVLGTVAGAGAPPAHLDLAPLPAWNLVPAALGDAALVLADGTRSAVSVRRGGRLTCLRALDVTPETPAAFVTAVRWALAVSGGAPPTVVLAGADASAAITTALATLPVTVVPLAAVAEPAAPPGGDLSACAVAAGLVAGAGRRRPATALAFDTGHRAAGGSLRPVSALAAAVVALALLDWGIARHELVRRGAALTAAVHDEAAAALPGARLVAPRAELEAAVGALARRQLRLGAHGGTLALLRELSTRVPDTLRPDLDELAVEPEEITLHGRADSFDAVDTLRRALAASPLLGDVTTEETRTTVDGRRVEFRLRAARRPAEGAQS